MHYRRLLSTRPWRALPDCPGRCVRDGPDAEIDGWVAQFATAFPEASARDEVLIWQLPGGGAVLSYRQAAGQLVHTLNTDEGLARKCAQLGIDLDGWRRRAREGVEVDGWWEVLLTAAGPDRQWARQLMLRLFPDLPAIEAVRQLDALPLRIPDLSRDRALALVGEVRAHGGEASAGPDGA